MGSAFAEKIKVAGIYTQPIQQKWDAVLHKGLLKAQEAGDIDYVYSEKVANTDYIRVLREYAESGVKLIVGEAFGISREAHKVAKDYPNVAFLMGDSFGPLKNNFAVFDNYIHEPCYLMGIIAGSMTKTGKIGMVGGYPIGEVNRLFNAFITGARSVNPVVEFKVSFIGSWYDPPKAKEFAFAQVEAGVDVLYAERAGVVDAARQQGIIAFGNVNDMNKEENGKDVVVTSAMWHMEAAIAHAIERVKKGDFKAEDYREWTMMAKGGASLAPYYEFDAIIPVEVKTKVELAKSHILAGTLIVPINDDEPKSTY
jgi:basic membrane lipoprotein Med (substrate-binding protein (PBP1-ABC) superfamily)